MTSLLSIKIPKFSHPKSHNFTLCPSTYKFHAQLTIEGRQNRRFPAKTDIPKLVCNSSKSPLIHNLHDVTITHQFESWTAQITFLIR